MRQRVTAARHGAGISQAAPCPPARRARVPDGPADGAACASRRRPRAAASRAGVRRAAGVEHRPRIIRPMHPNALLELPPNCCTGAAAEAPGRRRRLRLLPPAPRARQPRAPHAGRDHLHGAAQAPAVPAPRAVGQGRDGAAPGGARLAGQRRLPARSAERDRAAMAGAGRAPSTASTLPERAAPQPAGMAGRAPAGRRSATSSGRWSRPSNSAAPLDLRVNTLQGQARRRARRLFKARGIEALPTRRIRRSACASTASRRCTSSTCSCAATSRCRTKAASCWR